MHEIQYFMWVNCRTGSCEKREKVLKLHDFAACIRFGIARGLLMHAWSNLSLIDLNLVNLVEVNLNLVPSALYY